MWDDSAALVHAKVVFAPPIGAALKVTFDMNARLHDNMSIAKQASRAPHPCSL